MSFPETIQMILPRSLRSIFAKVNKEMISRLEEIRIREKRPLEIVYRGGYGFITKDGTIVSSPELSYIPNHEDCMQLIDLLSNHSLYTLEEELKKGFITIRGGHRVGLAGRTVIHDGQVKQIRDISSFNIRIAKELKGIGRRILPMIMDPKYKRVHHTLIISPPQMGKTTLIRDLSRLISSGHWPVEYAGWRGLKVGIVDERSEIAACYRGVPVYDVGPRTDVLDNCPKAEGMMMMIRSMSPELIVVDEIGRPEDAAAVMEAVHAGIRVMATVHGAHLEDVRKRPTLAQLMKEHIFSRFVVLGGLGEAGNVQDVQDAEGNSVMAIRSWKV